MRYGSSNTDSQQHVSTVVKYLLGAVLPNNDTAAQAIPCFS